MSAAEIPRQLIDAFRDRRAVIFLGAGVSRSAGLPSWQNLAADLAKDLDFPADLEEGSFSTDSLLKIPQYYENKFGRRALQQRLEELIQPNGASRAHDLIASLPCDLYYTTNFDELLESSLRVATEDERFPVIADENDARYHAGRRGLQVRKIHGTLSRPLGIVITRQDFARVRNRSQVMFEDLRGDLRDHSFLFIGYSLSDPDFVALYDDVLSTMGDMRQVHFICLPGATELERDDLKRRGFEVLDILGWDSDRSDISRGLGAFLDELADKTDDLTQIKRFFSGLRKGQEIPIVVSSQPHPDEKYIYVAESDLVVASEATEALAKLGCRGQRLTDYRALRDFDLLLEDDLVLVCSPFGNTFTRELYARADEHTSGKFTQVEFIQTDAGRAIVAKQGAKEFHADNPVTADGSGPRQEYALLARYDNPWTAGRSIYVLAGLHAIGTHAVGRFLGKNESFRALPAVNGRLEAVLTVEYVEHDPYDYDYKIADVHILSEDSPTG